RCRRRRPRPLTAAGGAWGAGQHRRRGGGGPPETPPQSFPTMSINPLANRPRADACSFGNGLRRLPDRALPYNPLSTARRQPGILMHVHPVLPWNLKLQQPQLPRSEPDGQPTESSQLANLIDLDILGPDKLDRRQVKPGTKEIL